MFVLIISKLLLLFLVMCICLGLAFAYIVSISNFCGVKDVIVHVNVYALDLCLLILMMFLTYATFKYELIPSSY